jgi:hypothetical protein
MATTKDLVEQLPEFPIETFEAAGVLERSERGPFLTIKPPNVDMPVPPQSAPTALAPTKSSFATRTYFAWATYPRVHCYDPGVFINEVATTEERAPMSDPGEHPTDLSLLARHERTYKLSSFQGRRFPDPLWCSVAYGPWLAALKETESCIDGDPNRWELSIAGMPELSQVWFGTVDDMPAVPSLTVYTNTLVESSTPTYNCCSGFKWCSTTQSCIRLELTCQDRSPA